MANGQKINNFGVIEFDKLVDKDKILERTKRELKKVNKPSVSYEVKILDLFRLTEMDYDYISIGDFIKVLDRDFKPAINYNLRVLSIDRNLLDVEDTVIMLGEKIKNIADSDSDLD